MKKKNTVEAQLKRSHLTKRVIAAIVLGFLMCMSGTLVVAYNLGANDGLSSGYVQGLVQGQKDTLANIQAIFKAGAITLNYSENLDGSYAIKILAMTSQGFETIVASISRDTFNILNMTGVIGDNHVPPRITVNVAWNFQLAEGAGVRDVLGSSGNLITDIGANYFSTIDCLSGLSNTTSYNSTCCIALGNQSATMSYADTQLSTEVPAGNGFSRATVSGTNITTASGTGIGSGTYYNVTYTHKFINSIAYTVNATSLQWSGVPVSNYNMAAEANIGTMPLGQAFNPLDNATIAYTLTFTH